jgi:hypothetical protein
MAVAFPGNEEYPLFISTSIASSELNMTILRAGLGLGQAWQSPKKKSQARARPGPKHMNKKYVYGHFGLSGWALGKKVEPKPGSNVGLRVWASWSGCP